MKEEIKIIRSKRKTLCLQVNAGGEVVIRAPWGLKKSRITDFLHEKEAWIAKKRKEIKVLQEESENISVLSEEEMKGLRKRAKEVFADRVAVFAAKMQVSYARISIRKQKSRWGSCSREGNLNFNLLLLLAPAKVLDYVVVHELCHRIEMNHSKKFWDLVGRYSPDYRECRLWLKENASRLMTMGGCR